MKGLDDWIMQPDEHLQADEEQPSRQKEWSVIIKKNGREILSFEADHLLLKKENQFVEVPGEWMIENKPTGRSRYVLFIWDENFPWMSGEFVGY